MAEQKIANIQKQTQTLSQKQVELLALLSLDTEELNKRIEEEVEKNPALIIKDKSNIYTYKNVTSGGEVAAEKHKALIERVPSSSLSLTEHLLHQLGMIKLPSIKERICKLLIYNLDKRGRHILAPASIIKKIYDKEDCEGVLNSCLSIVQSMDPSGVCVSNINESLTIQAKDKGEDTPLIKFLLEDLTLLSPPNPIKVQKKIKEKLKKLSSLAFNSCLPLLKESDITLEKVSKAVEFIKTLNPNPASPFRQETNNRYIISDIYVREKEGRLQEDNIDKGEICATSSFYFKIEANENSAINLAINTDFREENKNFAIKKSDKDFIEKKEKEAKSFISLLEYRKLALVRMTSLIVFYQKEFFIYGEDKLKVLTQEEVAKKLGVAASSVSRLALSKYLSCKWGIFPLKYFFSSGVESKKEGENKISSRVIKKRIQEIISKEGEKDKISDAELTRKLNSEGIKIARRTVTKYRLSLALGSSYKREGG